MSTDSARWRSSLKAFFDERGAAITGKPTLDDLCYIAGRDPRLWRSKVLRDGMADDICTHAEIDRASKVLEVGCAAGFLALAVAPRCGDYVGVDLAEAPIKVARRLGLPHARFKKADGDSLPFADATFDSAFCCDVFTNFPNASDGLPLIREMLRVVKPGRPVLIGNVPDRATAHDLPRRVAEINQHMEAEFGPRPVVPMAEKVPRANILGRISAYLAGQSQEPRVSPQITTYEFDCADFAQIALDISATVAFGSIHPTHPYFGYRFNAVFRAKST
jgi:ubiquinone/menaquinone biosynthesis C-methylase UbiE